MFFSMLITCSYQRNVDIMATSLTSHGFCDTRGPEGARAHAWITLDVK